MTTNEHFENVVSKKKSAFYFSLSCYLDQSQQSETGRNSQANCRVHAGSKTAQNPFCPICPTFSSEKTRPGKCQIIIFEAKFFCRCPFKRAKKLIFELSPPWQTHVYVQCTAMEDKRGKMHMSNNVSQEILVPLSL